METAKKSSNVPKKFICVIILFSASMIQCLQLDMSFLSPEDIFFREIKGHILNFSSILLVILLLVILTMRLHLACLIGGVISFVLSVVNHYVFMYSGGPFTPSQFAAARTAWNVHDSYSFAPDKFVFFSFICFLIEVCLAAIIKKLYPGKQHFELKRFGSYLLIFLLLFISYQINMHRHNWVLNARERSLSRGYATCFIEESFIVLGQSVIVPEGYTRDKLAEAAKGLITPPEESGETKRYPDIVLILNETFYDPGVYTDIKTDRPYLENYRNLNNSVKGYAVSPYSCGGTNDSEFELLTSLSDHLLRQRAPFNTSLPFDEISSIAAYLNSLGYSTQACHARDALNYSRKSVYPALGFDKTRFFEDFTEHEKNGNREETDAANYRDLIRWYEKSGDAPRFIYLLTYQNHGDFEQNRSAMDTVHVKDLRGAVAEQTNEYLSSIRLSDEALAVLTDYFDGIDRPVIVCMVGDHSPSFLYDIPGSYASNETEKDFLSRKIPFLIWGNNAFGKINEEKNQLLSMTDLVPRMLDTAGMPLSPYYNCLLELSRSVPVRNGGGNYITAGGTEDVLDPSDKLFEEISLPLYIEYAELTGEIGELDCLFDP